MGACLESPNILSPRRMPGPRSALKVLDCSFCRDDGLDVILLFWTRAEITTFGDMTI